MPFPESLFRNHHRFRRPPIPATTAAAGENLANDSCHPVTITTSPSPPMATSAPTNNQTHYHLSFFFAAAARQRRCVTPPPLASHQQAPDEPPHLPPEISLSATSLDFFSVSLPSPFLPLFSLSRSLSLTAIASTTAGDYTAAVVASFRHPVVRHPPLPNLIGSTLRTLVFHFIFPLFPHFLSPDFLFLAAVMVFFL